MLNQKPLNEFKNSSVTSDKKKKKKIISQTTYDTDYYQKKALRDELMCFEGQVVRREKNKSKDLID